MTKKIALLISLLMIFSFSLVFAVEGSSDSALLTAPLDNDTMTTGVSGNTDLLNTENVSLDVSGEASGEISEETANEISDENETKISGETINKTDVNEEKEEEPSKSSDSTVLGAVIAIIIVVAVVAIVALIQKK